MKTNFLIAFCSFLFVSCSTIYQTGQTPDDVYYSPTNGIARKNMVNSPEPSEYYNPDDNYLRMAVRNRRRWVQIDDFSYWYDSRYSFNNCNTGLNYGWNGFNYGFNNCFCNCNYNVSWGNNWQNWNSGFYVIQYKNPVIYKGSLSTSNITAYKNKSYSNNNIFYNPKTNNNSSSNNGLNNLGKKVTSYDHNGNAGTSWERPVRTNSGTTPASSSSGGNSGGFKSTGTNTSSGRGGRN